MKMKAWTLNEPSPVSDHPLTMAEIPAPTPLADQLLLRVAACGICRTDLHVVEGELPVHRSPLIPGHQIVGRVAGMGSRVEGFAIGDRVGVAWLNRTWRSYVSSALVVGKIYANKRCSLAGP